MPRSCTFSGHLDQIVASPSAGGSGQRVEVDMVVCIRCGRKEAANATWEARSLTDYWNEQTRPATLDALGIINSGDPLSPLLQLAA